ncbi:MAG: hypothetical protein IIA10_04400 [Proteobacteria bacterium]|nr:hypothetical protein [Pseudomonadota bacterium]
MSKLTKENRAALQSVRAKARKALAVTDADLPKAIIKNLEAVVAYVDKAIAPAKKAKAKDKAETVPLSEAA